MGESEVRKLDMDCEVIIKCCTYTLIPYTATQGASSISGALLKGGMEMLIQCMTTQFADLSWSGNRFELRILEESDSLLSSKKTKK